MSSLAASGQKTVKAALDEAARALNQLARSAGLQK